MSVIHPDSLDTSQRKYLSIIKLIFLYRWIEIKENINSCFSLVFLTTFATLRCLFTHKQYTPHNHHFVLFRYTLFHVWSVRISFECFRFAGFFFLRFSIVSNGKIQYSSSRVSQTLRMYVCLSHISMLPLDNIMQSECTIKMYFWNVTPRDSSRPRQNAEMQNYIIKMQKFELPRC